MIREGLAQRSQLYFWDKLLIKNGEYLTTARQKYLGDLGDKGDKGYLAVYDKSIITQDRLSQYEIEEVALARRIPLDAVAVKVSDEDALSVMKRELVEAAPQALKMVEAAVQRAGSKERILIIGVGNTCGVGNDSASVEIGMGKLAMHWKTEKSDEEKKSGWF